MGVPTSERVRLPTRPRTTIPTQRGVTTEPAAQPRRRSGREKAYARREERLRRVVGGRQVRGHGQAGRPQFILLVMVLLAGGLVASLWLSTAAAADSYRLRDATAEARALSERAEQLHREVATLQSPPELARRAEEMGMTQVQDSARLVVAPDGSVTVVGQPRAATPPPPPPVPPGAANAPVNTGGYDQDSTQDVPTVDGAADTPTDPPGGGTDAG